MRGQYDLVFPLTKLIFKIILNNKARGVERCLIMRRSWFVAMNKLYNSGVIEVAPFAKSARRMLETAENQKL